MSLFSLGMTVISAVISILFQFDHDEQSPALQSYHISLIYHVEDRVCFFLSTLCMPKALIGKNYIANNTTLMFNDNYAQCQSSAIRIIGFFFF